MRGGSPKATAALGAPSDSPVFPDPLSSSVGPYFWSDLHSLGRGWNSSSPLFTSSPQLFRAILLAPLSTHADDDQPAAKTLALSEVMTGTPHPDGNISASMPRRPRRLATLAPLLVARLVIASSRSRQGARAGSGRPLGQPADAATRRSSPQPVAPRSRPPRSAWPNARRPRRSPRQLPRRSSAARRTARLRLPPSAGCRGPADQSRGPESGTRAGFHRHHAGTTSDYDCCSRAIEWLLEAQPAPEQHGLIRR